MGKMAKVAARPVPSTSVNQLTTPCRFPETVAPFVQLRRSHRLVTASGSLKRYVIKVELEWQKRLGVRPCWCIFCFDWFCLTSRVNCSFGFADAGCMPCVCAGGGVEHPVQRNPMLWSSRNGLVSGPARALFCCALFVDLVREMLLWSGGCSLCVLSMRRWRL